MDALFDYFSRIARYEWWIVFVELLLIGLVIWWVVDFLEGTRGERLFRGVIFILLAGVLILNLVVERLPFDRLQYLYKGFLIAVLIVAVAAFQPEIRRVLIQIGQPRIWTGSSHQLSRTVEELVSAVTQLSAGRIGAIVVIEREVALGEFIETGVRLDARVTADLLKSIFYPGAALHDMAVVIRGDRVVAARVQLPLAEAGTVDGIELGSRHRAALGITAGSDATCLVVSEETGAISISQEGKLVRNVTESQVRSCLANAMTEDVPLVGRLLKRHA
ncbi:MAG: diadenylate cyclase CdaA [Sedimentisphaerales bacterium]|nr:diadenylate cyclase CdaA [Sedimentisphaerales bacterium]